MTQADPLLNVALIVPRTEAEGPGMRFALWVQGCPLRCPGCCNPEMLQEREATRMSAVSVVEQIVATRARDASLEGVSFLGGEPTAQARAVAAVARGVRAHGMSVMIFSGYTLQELRDRRDPDTDDLIAHTDLLVDGRYDERVRTTTRRWVGSDNQTMHFLSSRYRPDDPRFHETNTLELRMKLDATGGLVTINGFPVRGART